VLQVPTATATRSWPRCASMACRRHSPRGRQAQRPRRDGGVARRQGVFSAPLRDLHQAWDEVSWRIARLRDNPACADAEHAAAGPAGRPGLHLHLSFDPAEDVAAPFIATGAPAQGGHPARAGRQLAPRDELRHAPAGFDTFDVHMSDLQAGRARWTSSRASSPAAASATATRWAPARAGRVGPVQPEAGRAQFAAFFARPTPSRWACATAAR
jgi:phosphoribosylformylglycinamidine synthase